MDLLSVLSLGAVRVLPLFDLVLAALVLVPSGLGVVPFGPGIDPWVACPSVLLLFPFPPRLSASLTSPLSLGSE